MSHFGLSQAQVQHYQEQGFLSPIRVLSSKETLKLKNEIQGLGAARDGQLPPALNMKAHLLIPSLWELVHSPAIIEPVKSLLGHDILCWASSFFDKLPATSHYVAWHQDSTYWGLERDDALTAWIALTDSNNTNGGLEVIPASHKKPQLKHMTSNDKHNMLLGNEVLDEPFNEEDAQYLNLQPGEMSLHHQRIIHGSGPNHSQTRRTAFAIRYIDGSMRGSSNTQAYATLISGHDHGGFLLEQKPEGLMDRQALKRHLKILKRNNTIIQNQIELSSSAPLGANT